jgi:hypothetical protein
LFKGRYTLSVKLSDFIVWHHTWRKIWVNYVVLTGNSRTVLSSRISHRELRSSIRESHSFLSLPAEHHDGTRTRRKTELTKTWETSMETCAVSENIQFSISCSFFYTVKLYSWTFWSRNFLLNFSTPCNKMWIIQEPKKVALLNKRHFEEEKTESVQHV